MTGMGAKQNEQHWPRADRQRLGGPTDKLTLVFLARTSHIRFAMAKPLKRSRAVRCAKI
jgi:hypothetical protein